MNITEYIGQYEKVENFQIEKFPAFFARLKIAQNTLYENKQNTTSRGLNAPFYLTDLGVRKSDSPKRYASLVASILNVNLPDQQDVLNEMLSISIDSLDKWFDIVMLLTGDYEVICHTIIKRKKEILSSQHLRLLLFSGTALSACNDEKYRDFFNAASYIENESFEEKVILQHRLAVSELKRSKNVQSFNTIVSNILSNYDMSKSEEFWVVLGLLNNLSGLAQVKDHSTPSILTLTMVNADCILNAALKKEQDVTKADMILRYLGQVAINRSQLAMANNDLQSAIDIMKISLKRNLDAGSLYAGEAYGILSVMEFKGSRFEDALLHADKARVVFKQIGDISAMEASYKITIGSLSKMNMVEKAMNLSLKVKNNSKDLYI